MSVDVKRDNVGVRKCPKCGSVWYTALPKCAFCGVEGEELKGPIPPSKLALGRGGVSTLPVPKETASEPPAPPEAKPVPPPAENPAVEAAPAPTEKLKEKDEPTTLLTPPPLPPAEASTPSPAGPAPAAPPSPPPAAPAPERAAISSGVAARKPLVRLEPKKEDPTGAAPLAPKIPSATVPLVFGLLGLVACLGMILLVQVRHDRVLGVLVLLGWAVLAPFGPFAWFAGQRHLDRCRELGFRAAATACAGKILGMAAVFLLTFELSALAIYMAVQLLSGKGLELPPK